MNPDTGLDHSVSELNHLVNVLKIGPPSWERDQASQGTPWKVALHTANDAVTMPAAGWRDAAMGTGGGRVLRELLDDVVARWNVYERGRRGRRRARRMMAGMWKTPPMHE